MVKVNVGTGLTLLAIVLLGSFYPMLPLWMPVGFLVASIGIWTEGPRVAEFADTLKVPLLGLYCALAIWSYDCLQLVSLHEAQFGFREYSIGSLQTVHLSEQAMHARNWLLAASQTLVAMTVLAQLSAKIKPALFKELVLVAILIIFLAAQSFIDWPNAQTDAFRVAAFGFVVAFLLYGIFLMVRSRPLPIGAILVSLICVGRGLLWIL